MNEIFDLTARPDTDLFSKKFDSNESSLGEIVSSEPNDFHASDIVILGFLSSENETASSDSDAIRREFYKLTNFGISRKIFDLGNIQIGENPAQTYETFTQVVEQILRDGKRLIVIGGKKDISYSSGLAMAKSFGKDRWLAINVDSHLDAHPEKRVKKSAFRQLLEERIIVPEYFYEIAFQPYFCSPVLYRYLQDCGVKMVSLEQIRSRETADLELRELIRQEFIHHSNSMSILFNFSMNAVRASDAPGVSCSSPFGLRSGEFLTLVEFSARLVNTKIIQFTEVKPESDVDHRTAKLIAIAIHRFCTKVAKI